MLSTMMRCTELSESNLKVLFSPVQGLALEVLPEQTKIESKPSLL